MASVGALLALCTLGPKAAEDLGAFSIFCYRHPLALVGGDPAPIVQEMIKVLTSLALPSVICAALAALAIGFAQAGFNPQTELVTPNLERLDPFGRIKSMFAPGQALFDLAQSILRVCALGWVVYATVLDALPRLIALSRADLRGAAHLTASSMATLALRAAAVLAVLSGADYFFSRFRWEKRNMMTKQEVKEEFKRQEGNQQVKAQMRAIARSRLKRGLAKQVRESDVVLANPTHISVALRYRAREGAPVVTAKGYDDVALFIRELAKEANVPVVENRLLARALAAKVRVGRAIPMELYAAVAEVLAFVYRLRGRVIM